MDSKQQLLELSIDFLNTIKNKTPGTDLEKWLNATHGPGSNLFEALAGLVKTGVNQGWAANIEVDGKNYRRSRIAEPSEETFHFSITAVYMNSDSIYQGQYHSHPYGELNLVAPITSGASISGPNGWCNGGWTAPSPGSHHYPEVKGGAAIALFYLPAGRISYDVQPPS